MVATGASFMAATAIVASAVLVPPSPSVTRNCNVRCAVDGLSDVLE